MKRLKNYSEDIITLSVSRSAAFAILKSAIERHGEIKEVSPEQDVIVAKAWYGLQMTKLEFELTEINGQTTIKCRGESGDISNGGAMRVIDKINYDLSKESGEGVEIKQDKKANRISTKKKILYALVAIVAFLAIKLILNGPGDIYGRYYSDDGTKSSYIELRDDGQFYMNFDGDERFEYSKRWGQYSINEENSKVNFYFKDNISSSRSPLEVILSSSPFDWYIIIGNAVVFTKDDKLSQKLNEIEKCNFTNLSDKFYFKVFMTERTSENNINAVDYINVEVYDKSKNEMISHFGFLPTPNIQFACVGHSHKVGNESTFSGEDGDYGDFIVMDINFDGNDDIVIKRDYGRIALYNYYIQIGYGVFVYNKFLSEETYGFPSLIDVKKTSLHFVYPAGVSTVKKDIVKFDKVSKHWYLDKSVEENL